MPKICRSKENCNSGEALDTVVHIKFNKLHLDILKKRFGKQGESVAEIVRKLVIEGSQSYLLKHRKKNKKQIDI